MKKPEKLIAGVKLRNKEKLSRIPIKIIPTEPEEALRKPKWIRIKLPSSQKRIKELKEIMRANNLSSVCEEASCPNLAECFNHGTATFMILGAICTRRCPFCDVGHGKPLAPDADEPKKLAEAIAKMKLKYVVITSVDRDDLKDGGASHFGECIKEIRKINQDIKIEILVPDFRGRIDRAIAELNKNLPDVFNHNMETSKEHYKRARPGANYKWSLELLRKFKEQNPSIPTKSGLMVGLGESDEEIINTLKDLKDNNVNMLTIGQYLQPSKYHLKVARYVTPEQFDRFKQEAEAMGFTQVASGPLVRSSYHADLQSQGKEVK